MRDFDGSARDVHIRLYLIRRYDGVKVSTLQYTAPASVVIVVGIRKQKQRLSDRGSQECVHPPDLGAQMPRPKKNDGMQAKRTHSSLALKGPPKRRASSSSQQGVRSARIMGQHAYKRLFGGY